MRRRIIIAGGSGFIGRYVAAHFRGQGDRVMILTRKAPASADELLWDGRSLGAWQGELEGADLLLNLCGKSVNCRYTRRNRRAIYQSRLESTRILALAMANCLNPPRVWLNSSSATIYRHAEDRDMDEATGEIGTGFSVEVCKQWEREFFIPDLPGTRRVALRTAIVMGPGSGGPFEAFRLLVKLGLGGTLGNGRQYMSWVHIRDFCRSLDWVWEHSELSGVINVAAPNPLTSRNFLAILRRAAGRRFGLPATRWMLECGAFVLRTETELLLKSRRVIPKRLIENGFKFDFANWDAAADDLLSCFLNHATIE